MKKKIVVVGAGSAGWITLSYLISTLPDFEYTIIFDSDTDVIGVGESTTPTIKKVASTVGVDEIEWLRESKGTIKYGVMFENWNNDNKSWFHNFDDIIPGNSYFDVPSDIPKNSHTKPDSVDLSLALYKKTGLTNKEYNQIHGPQQDMYDENISPFTLDLKSNISEWPGYSYHINAQLFGHSLKSAIDKKNHSYTIINDRVDTFIQDEEGNVTSLITKLGSKIDCDFVFDCSGFARTIIGKLSTFMKYDDMICNSAIAGIAKIDHHDLCTTAVAKPYGWIWETPTFERMGSGYVYCDKFISHEQAEIDFKNHWKDKGLEINIVKRFSFQSGRMKDICVNNVISNGLCQSFIEPLEATSVMLTCATVIRFVETYKKHNQIWSTSTSKSFSKLMSVFLEHTKYFVKFHYLIAKRSDTDFWKYWNKISVDIDAVTDYNSYIKKFLKNRKLAEPGETVFNQRNLVSMLIGLEQQCTLNFDITDEQLERFKFVSELNRINYRDLIKHNLKQDDFLRIIHNLD